MLLDLEQVIDNTGGDRDLVVNIAKIFIKRHKEQLDVIKDSIEVRDGEKLWRSAHTLKGTVSYFLVDSINSAVKELEQHGRKNDFEGVKEIFTEFENLVNELVVVLKSEFSI